MRRVRTYIPQIILIRVPTAVNVRLRCWWCTSQENVSTCSWGKHAVIRLWIASYKAFSIRYGTNRNNTHRTAVSYRWIPRTCMNAKQRSSYMILCYCLLWYSCSYMYLIMRINVTTRTTVRACQPSISSKRSRYSYKSGFVVYMKKRNLEWCVLRVS